MHKQPVRTSSDTKIPRIHKKYTHNRKEGHRLHRQPDDPGLHKKHQYPHISYRYNSTTNIEDGAIRMEGQILLGQGTRRNPG